MASHSPFASPRTSRLLLGAVVAALLGAAAPQVSAQPHPMRPFGTLREQAEVQQRWLEQRMRTVLPALMRKHGVDSWVIPMREYNEDPTFSSLVSPTTFAARRRTIYVFFDKCAAGGRTDPGDGSCIERIALGGTSQGGVYEARRAMKTVTADVGGRQAELWGDEQWQVLKDVLEERSPKVVAINTSRTFAFTDGLTSGERDGMTEALGTKWSSRFRPAEALALELIATRLPEEEAYYGKLQALVWELTQRMFSAEVITPGVTRTSDLVWWWRQQVNDRGLGTWFQPSVSVQRRGTTAAALGEDPVIQRGDVLHCDVGITALGLATDTQHNAYVLLPGETAAPAGLTAALHNANKLQDIVMEELRPGRTGNEILASSLQRMKAGGIDGTVYSHPIGKHGHGAGPLLGLWDYQDGVPGRGDARVIPSMWYSIELQATTKVAEWGGQAVRMAQEEDAIIGADGRTRWAIRRQDQLFLVR
ncbi:MAG: M24 family metallopeptidase [Gemmatimonadales bacterium]|nr:M24 family metallopeptidase [Gemmatimonadales bacterium]